MLFDCIIARKTREYSERLGACMNAVVVTETHAEAYLGPDVLADPYSRSLPVLLTSGVVWVSRHVREMLASEFEQWLLVWLSY